MSVHSRIDASNSFAAQQQAGAEEDLRFHLPCELEEEIAHPAAASHACGTASLAPLPQAGGAGDDLSPDGHSSQPNPHKSHPAGRGWIAARRDIGLPGEGPDAEQAAFGASGGGIAGGVAGFPSSSFPSSPSPHDEEGHLPHTTFTPDRQMRFCDQLATCGNVRMACALSGISAMTAYRTRRRDSLFAEVWDRALALARDHAEAVLAVRALEGIAEPVFHRGEVVGHRRRYDSRLLLAHLARLDRRCEVLDARAAHGAPGDVEAFDLMLARLGGLDEGEGGLLSRGAHVEQAGAEAERAALEEAFAGDPWGGELEPDYEAGEDEEDEGEDAADWEGTGPDPILVAAQEARARAGAEWDEAHVALCTRIDALCRSQDNIMDEDAEEVNPLPVPPLAANLPYEIKSWAGSGAGAGCAAGAGSAAKGCVTGVTGWPVGSARHPCIAQQ